MGWSRSRNIPDSFCYGKRQGAPYLHGKKSAQKLRGKHIFLEHDIDDSRQRQHDDNIVLCPSLLALANMNKTDTARNNTVLLLLSFIIGENK